jgi:uncharacterized protein DUF6894
MARYYFDFVHSDTQTQCLDDVGTELTNDHAAVVEAVQAAAEWLKDNASVDAKITVQVRAMGEPKPLCAVTASIRMEPMAKRLPGSARKSRFANGNVAGRLFKSRVKDFVFSASDDVLAAVREHLDALCLESGARRSHTLVQGRTAGVLSHTGSAITHASPSARQSKRISPFSWPRIMPSITRVPKPRRVGGSTGGPPVSVQRRTRRPSDGSDHSIRTCASATDRAPCLAALVTSSCRATATA